MHEVFRESEMLRDQHAGTWDNIMCHLYRGQIRIRAHLLQISKEDLVRVLRAWPYEGYTQQGQLCATLATHLKETAAELQQLSSRTDPSAEPTAASYRKRGLQHPLFACANDPYYYPYYYGPYVGPLSGGQAAGRNDEAESAPQDAPSSTAEEAQLSQIVRYRSVDGDAFSFISDSDSGENTDRGESGADTVSHSSSDHLSSCPSGNRGSTDCSDSDDAGSDHNGADYELDDVVSDDMSFGEGESDAEMTLNLGGRVTGSGRREGSGESLETSVLDDALDRPQ